MAFVTDEDHMKVAFRTAFNFLKSHRAVLYWPPEYTFVTDDMRRIASECNNDPLTMHLVTAVYDFICEISKQEAGK